MRVFHMPEHGTWPEGPFTDISDEPAFPEEMPDPPLDDTIFLEMSVDDLLRLKDALTLSIAVAAQVPVVIEKKGGNGRTYSFTDGMWYSQMLAHLNQALREVPRASE